MSTVLIYTSPARGHLYPMLDVALALRAAGHRVVLQTLADERDRVVAEGLEHRPIAVAIEALGLRDDAGRNPVAQIRATFDCTPAAAQAGGTARGPRAMLRPCMLLPTLTPTARSSPGSRRTTRNRPAGSTPPAPARPIGS